MKRSGIYTITNLVNGKMYLGQTTNLIERWKKGHLVTLRRKAHSNTYLQRAWNKYGESNFIWEELEECDEKYLHSQEHYWAHLLDVHNPKRGYNDKPTHPEGKNVVSYTTRVKMSESAKINSKKRDHNYLREFATKKRVKVAQYTTAGVFVNKFDSKLEAAKVNNMRTGPISEGCLKGVIRAGYRWLRYENDCPTSLPAMLTLKEQQDIKREESRIKKVERQKKREHNKLLKEELRLARLSHPRGKRLYTVEDREKMLANLTIYRGTNKRREGISKRVKGSNNPRATLNEQIVYEIRKEITIKLDKKFASRWDMIEVRNGIKEKFNLSERKFQQIKGFECWKDIIYIPE